MGKLTEEEREQLRTQTVEVLLEVRRHYLMEHGSSVAMKHWDHLLNETRIGAKTCGSPEEWVTQIGRRLRLPALLSSGCQALVDLTCMIRERDCRREWFDMLEREDGLLLAVARVTAEKRKESGDVQAIQG